MDIKLLNLNKEKVEKEESIEKEELREIFKNKISKLLNIDILQEKYIIKEADNDYIDFLILDENKRIGIVEFRNNKNEALIKEGLNHIDYIKAHLSQFKMIVCDSVKNKDDVIYDPYLMIISTNLCKNDYNAISHLPYDIELYSLNKYKSECVFNKAYVSRKMNLSNFNANVDIKYKNVVNEIIDYNLNLGEEVTLFAYKNKMMFKRLYTYLILEFNDDLNIYIKKKDKWTKIKSNDFDLIDEAFDEA